MSLRISVITPNYNCADYLEQTIVSVISQGYLNLEYIIVDGASTDRSMEIIEQYHSHFAHVISEPDNGHADALNKGFSLATGDVLCWINSDDLLMPNSLAVVDAVFSMLDHVQWITGIPSVADESGTVRRYPRRMWSWQRFLSGDFRHIQQESTFWRRSLLEKCGGKLNGHLRLANDFELWLRFFNHAALYTLDAPLGCFRSRQGQRSIALAEDYETECEHAFADFINSLPITQLSDHIALVPDDQLLSRRQKPVALPIELSIFDPPLITINSKTGLPELLNNSEFTIPMKNSIDARVIEDLVFDGIDRVLWRGGPDFSKYKLAAVEIDLVPFSPSAAVVEPLGEYSPPMPCVIGPMSLSDWGQGKHTIQMRFAQGTISHDLQLSEMGRCYRLKLLLEKQRYTVLLDGHVVATGKTLGNQTMQGREAIIGGGHAQRYWLGAIDKVTVVLRPLEGEVTNSHQTYEISHTDGFFSLPRQRRAAFAKPQVLRTQLRGLATPLSAWRNKHQGKRCFVMGNGPSLNKMDLNKLAGETVFACNAAFLLFDRLKWRPIYYTCVDTRVIRDRAAEITAMLDAHPEITAFFPAVVHLHDGSGLEFAGRSIITLGSNRHYFNEVGNRESHHVETMFSLDADDYVVQPYTVAITMLQLATYMGFSEIYLIGCDTSYKVQSTVQQEGRKIDGVGLCLTSTRDDDENHFDPRYFGQGREWHNPQVAKMLEHYRWARLAARRKGIRIFNATVGGQLEVFERVAFDSLFPKPPSQLNYARPPAPPGAPLLSIAIPAYDRAESLMQAIKSFVEQIKGRFEQEVEIVVSDDCTPDDRLSQVRDYARQYSFVRWRRYEKNIGLERNLLACADSCTGEFLWIFGDDDFLERDDALATVLDKLRQGKHDVLVLNRTRRSTDLQTLISPNWMGLETSLCKPFSGLREFCLEFGFISVLGFISVNIFRRRQFQRIDASRFMGTMYPQLGAMLEAFHSRPTLLIGDPIVCHRTQTPEEKRCALGAKASEAEFMADTKRRNAIYFSHPYVAMLDDLATCGAFSYDDVMKIPENTVINGPLVDFLINCVRLNDELQVETTEAQWMRTAEFFRSLPLDAQRKERIRPVLDRHYPIAISREESPANSDGKPLTISVVTPSFNQAEFLPDCLNSVRDQTYPAIEHLVFDPGSKDGSREIASAYPHVTLFAEPDKGQSDALNKGFARAKGSIIAWLNSDDMLADPAVFERAIARFNEPDSPDIVYGRGTYVDEHGKKLRDAYINSDPGSLIWRFHQEDGIMQPALFMRRSVIERVGPLRGELHFSMDYEYWIRCVKSGVRFVFLDSNLAVARYHLNNKTYGQRGSSYEEVCRMTKEHYGYVNHMWLKRYAEFLSDGHDGVLAHAGNVGIRDKSLLAESYRNLLAEHNGDEGTLKNLLAHREERGYAETFQEMKGLHLIEEPLSHSASTLQILSGPFNRSSVAHYDETDCIAELFKGVLQGQVMIDVGAHHGWAHAPFLDRGWRIYAFEPDNQNRAKLLERLAKHKNKDLVSLDTRCVSNKAQKGVSFFTSEQSTGISGLSAFHETHVEAQKVDTTTLTEFFQDKHLPEVDFLKIDTEGHDLFVLQGFPWDRGQPAVIECEFEDTKTVPLGYTFHDLASFLLGKGYTVYVSEWHPIIRYGIRHDWNQLLKYPCELADPKGWGNLIAFRNPIGEKDLIAAVKKVLKVGATQGNPPATVETAKPVALSGRVSGSGAASKPAPCRVPTTIAYGAGFRVEPTQHFTLLTLNQWRYTHSGAPQKLWAAVIDAFGQTAGRSMTGGIRLQSDRAMTVNVSLGRHGKTEYEGASKRIKLVPGVANNVRLSKEFTKAHDAFKIQVEVLDMEGGGSAEIKLDALYVSESLTSIRRRVDEENLTLREANRLFREGDMSTAMGMYLLLHEKRPMKMYPDNALMAARKLGMGELANVEELLDRVGE